MRKLSTCMLIAAITIAMPTLLFASDQEIAQRIANKLKDSGQLVDYKISVKCQDGTIWLRGQVQNEQQTITALKLALGTPGVERVVNELTTSAGETSAEKANETAERPKGLIVKSTVARMMETTSESSLGNATEVPSHADKLPASFMRELAKPVSAIDRGDQEPAAKTRQWIDTPSTNQQPLPLENPSTTRRPVPLAYKQTAASASPVVMASQPVMTSAPAQAIGTPGPPLPMYAPGVGGGVAPARFDQPALPNYAWPSYAAYPNYAAVTYPKQYSPTAWPYIGPFYPYPQVPLGWRKVTLEWEDGWWMLDFKDTPSVWDPPVGRWY